MRLPAALLLVTCAAAHADPLADLKETCAAASDPDRRDTALARALTLDLDPTPLKVEGPDRLVYPFAGRVTGENGQVTLDGGDDRATASVKPELAGAIVKARERGKLVARATFRLREGAVSGNTLEQPCSAVGGGRFMTIRVAPLSVELLAEGKPLARALTERGAVEPSAAPQPRVDLSPPTVSGASGHDADALAEAALPLKSRALDCYRASARTGPLRTGTIALQITASSHGTVDDATPLIDGLRDDLVRGCLIEAAKNVRFPRTRHGAKITLSLAFALTPAR